MDSLQTSDFIFLSSHTSASSATCLGTIVAASDVLHDLAQEGDTARVGIDGGFWVVVCCIELYCLPG